MRIGGCRFLIINYGFKNHYNGGLRVQRVWGWNTHFRYTRTRVFSSILLFGCVPGKPWVNSTGWLKQTRRLWECIEDTENQAWRTGRNEEGSVGRTTAQMSSHGTSLATLVISRGSSSRHQPSCCFARATPESTLQVQGGCVCPGHAGSVLAKLGKSVRRA